MKKIDKSDLSIYEKDVDINLAVLLDIYREYDEAPSYHNKLFLDIEIEGGGGAINLQMCQNAPVKITAVAIYDDNGKEYFVYLLDEAGALKPSKNDNVNIIPFRSERELLLAFLEKWQEIDPTIVIHWNGDTFDIPYLYNRMKRVLGEFKANQLSPLGIVYFDEYDPKMPYKIAGITSFDYMRLYKKFIPKQQPSYALDAIGKKEIKQGKIVYEGSLDHLFRTDPIGYAAYNVNDVKIIVGLDVKKKFIDLAIMVCHMAHVPYHYIYQSSKVVEGAIMTYLKRKDIVSPNKPTTMHPELKVAYGSDTEDDDKFAGAYVKDPVPGLYGWNGDLDLESLYPSLGILLNLGIETFLFKIRIADPFDDSWNLYDLKEKDPDQTVTIENLDGLLTDIRLGDLIDMIEENDIIISPNGVAFDSGSESILAEVMNHWFKVRKEMKGKMLDAGRTGDKVSYELYDRYQAVFKVFLNSIYGVLALKSFRYSDGKDHLASAITAAGRLTIMKSADYTNQLIHDIFNADQEEVVDQVLMSDTDSMYISAEGILKYYDVDPTDDDAAVKTLRETFKYLADDLNEYYKVFSKERFNSSNNRLKTKSETNSKKLYISKKKHYAQLIIDKEGVKMEGDDRFDFKGLDFMKSSYPPLFKTFMEGLVKDILLDATKGTLDDKILDFREKFKTLPLEDVAKPTGINKMKEYIQFKPKDKAIFTSFLPKAPPNTKGAVYYNDLLRFFKLDKQYSIIQVGDKMKWMYLKDNPYKIKVLGFPGYYPAPEIMELVQKYMDREQMWNTILVKKLQMIYDNLSWGEINFNKNTRKFFRYKEK